MIQSGHYRCQKLLPANLEVLQCHVKQIVLPNLPASLTKLECSNFAYNSGGNFPFVKCAQTLKHLVLYETSYFGGYFDNLEVLHIYAVGIIGDLLNLPQSLRVLKLAAVGRNDCVDIKIPPGLRSLSVKASRPMFRFYQMNA